MLLESVGHILGIRPTFYQGDIRDSAILQDIFAKHDIVGVIHFADLKAVGESVEKPLMYYDNNVSGTLNLVIEMDKAGVKRIIFSSSATVYGDPASAPTREDFPTSATNSSGRSG